MSKAALVIALLALVGTWGGPAVADTLLTGDDIENSSLTGRDITEGSLSSGDIRNGGLLGRDIRRGAIPGAKIKDRSLKGRDVKSNSLTGRVIAGLSGRDLLPNSVDGSDIAEETLDVQRARTAGRADSAATADSATTAGALAGMGFGRVRASLAPGAGATVLDLGGLILTAGCGGDSVLALRASARSGGGFVRVEGVRGGGGGPTPVYAEDDDFGPGDDFDALAGAPDDLSARLVYAAPDGGVVTLAFLAESGLPSGGCLVAGTATHAAG